MTSDISGFLELLKTLAGFLNWAVLGTKPDICVVVVSSTKLLAPHFVGEATHSNQHLCTICSTGNVLSYHTHSILLTLIIHHLVTL